MGTKHAEIGHAGASVAVADPAKVRNVVLVGPSGSGKTTLTEALLAAAGVINRAGSVTEGTTVCDQDPAAVRQQRSVGLAVAPLVHDDVKVNLIDTPGYADFVGELRAGLRAADAALFVVSGSEDVDAATVALWEECAAVRMPRAVVISRLDHHRADFDSGLAACQRAFGAGVLPLYLPVPGDGTTRVVGLVTRRVFDYSGGFPPLVKDPDPDLEPLVDRHRDALIEGIIAESEDETLMDRYLAGEEIDQDTLIRDLETAVVRGSFHPVLPVCAATGVGISELLEVLTRGFPSPLEHDLPEVSSPDGIPRPRLSPDPSGPLVAEVVRTAVDAYVGRVSLVRVFSGTLRPERSVHVSGHGLADRGHADHDADERVAHIYSPLGANLREVPYCVAGDLCALTKLGTAETGDTLSAPNDPLVVRPWDMPEPLLPVAVVARSRSDEDNLARNLSRLVAGDPTLRLERNPETHQLVLWCMGEAHADVVLQRLRAGGAEVDTEPVRVALRETFAGPAKGHGRHVKQSGGHGQYAVCDIQVEPLPRGSGLEFVDRIVGGAIPNQFIPSVEKGVRAQMARGLLAGYPVVDIRVTLVDGKAHSVDSSDAAFQTAGALALRDAAANARLTLLEPVDEIAVLVPDEHMGTILGDLSGRRGRVLGTEGGGPGRTLIKAEVPATELVRYAVELRSMTSGTATFTRRFARHEPLPESLAAKVEKNERR
ncbi:elongation factor G [Streptoalloteichus tenebrarius]|uniref:Elongation factor G n=1 Tax=Streptoalloteichus tenebrarius (strain ATCC 17920 / DSM 40477 / JCM 4838 / CBS 697.72 / NBRC 16177 / NCIMB 11028 / NRRL B-12390 / A12253. 1 / ISP 5477) TaxID=1933 RepID=A0ABT1HSB1_STRSD|nr:elongation factor G-like protein EF-G2 [Streptoalloteichus tenebrarius]MCP2258368.1 elongation factor G [Streptoalloteichus tenebrarius]BFF03535.1 elongation factor G-like protein EF-G2 [Streptoalloteichus tenebrarius]